jgi:hypothetical protein
MTSLPAEGVHWCVANGRLVLLDLKADQYSCLPEDTDRACRKLIAGQPLDPEDQDVINNLPEAHLFAGGEGAVRSSYIPVATRSLLDRVGRQANASPSIWAVWDQLRFGALLKFASLFRLIEAVRRRKRKSPKHALSSQIESDIMRFMASRRLLSRQSQCLRTSLALAAYLARRGYHPNLVIGVRMSPFAAHAWVQDGDTVLNDSVDEVAPFTPILVV